MNLLNPFKGAPQIILIDDSEEHLLLVRTKLKKNGFNPTTFLRGDKAKEELRHLKPDIILLDYQLEPDDIKSFDLCKELRTFKHLDYIPIILFTADQSTEIIRGSHIVGFDDYLSKPFKIDDLLNLIQTQAKLFNKKLEMETRYRISSELLHLLSHDMINNLYSGLSLVDIMEEDKSLVDTYLPVVKEALEGSLKTTDKARSLVSLGENQTSINTDYHPVEMIYNHILEFWSDKAKNKKIDFDFKKGEDIQVYVEVKIFYTYVLDSLISNAIKYSPPNSKIIVSHESKENYTKVTVEDKGIGIPKNLLENIFDISKSRHRSGTLDEGGLGFGLPMAKYFLTFFGGSIEIESRDIVENPKDSGTKVSFYLKSKK